MRLPKSTPQHTSTAPRPALVRSSPDWPARRRPGGTCLQICSPKSQSMARDLNRTPYETQWRKHRRVQRLTCGLWLGWLPYGALVLTLTGRFSSDALTFALIARGTGAHDLHFPRSKPSVPPLREQVFRERLGSQPLDIPLFALPAPEVGRFSAASAQIAYMTPSDSARPRRDRRVWSRASSRASVTTDDDSVPSGKSTSDYMRTIPRRRPSPATPSSVHYAPWGRVPCRAVERDSRV